MDDAIDALVPAVDCGQGLEGLPEVGEVDAGERSPRIRRADAIEVHDLVLMGQELVDHSPAEFAAPAGHRYAHRYLRAEFLTSGARPLTVTRCSTAPTD